MVSTPKLAEQCPGAFDEQWSEIKDADFGNGIIFIRNGKGGKDRMVPMPKSMAADAP